MGKLARFLYMIEHSREMLEDPNERDLFINGIIGFILLGIWGLVCYLIYKGVLQFLNEKIEKDPACQDKKSKRLKQRQNKKIAERPALVVFFLGAFVILLLFMPVWLLIIICFTVGGCITYGIEKLLKLMKIKLNEDVGCFLGFAISFILMGLSIFIISRMGWEDYLGFESKEANVKNNEFLSPAREGLGYNSELVPQPSYMRPTLKFQDTVGDETRQLFGDVVKRKGKTTLIDSAVGAYHRGELEIINGIVEPDGFGGLRVKWKPGSDGDIIIRDTKTGITLEPRTGKITQPTSPQSGPENGPTGGKEKPFSERMTGEAFDELESTETPIE